MQRISAFIYPDRHLIALQHKLHRTLPEGRISTRGFSRFVLHCTVHYCTVLYTVQYLIWYFNGTSGKRNMDSCSKYGQRHLAKHI